MIVMKKQFKTIMKEKIPKDLIGMIGDVVHAKNATDDVNEVTNIWTAAFLQV